MADDRDTGLGFRIRPLPPKSQQPEPPPPEPPAPVSEPTPESVDGFTHSGGLFHSAQAVMAFLGAVAGARLANTARAWRGPERRWWVEVAVPWQQAASLIASARGMPYAGRPRSWFALPADGSAPTPTSRKERLRKGEISLHHESGTERLKPTDWTEVDLRDLIIATPLRPTELRRLDEVIVVTPGVLGRTILRRAADFGFAVELSLVTRQPLTVNAEVHSAVMLSIRWQRDSIPRAFLKSLLQLPDTAVSRAVAETEPELGETPARALLVDIRYRVPLSSTLVATLVPENECWLLAGPELGFWCLHTIGAPVNGLDLLDIPAIDTPAASSATVQDSELPQRLALKLVPRRSAPSYPDAVLLDDAELKWTKTFLMGVNAHFPELFGMMAL